jgi:hypothetical protein
MNRWGPDTFGDPCRECGFDWSQSRGAAHAVVIAAPDAIATLVDGRDGRERTPELSWTAGGYVCHVADSIRVWAERLASVALGDAGPIAQYDQERLADARHYADVGIAGALWSLRRAVGDWQAAVELATARATTMVHPELGEMTLLEVTLIRAHDVTHHTMDIARSLAG